MSLPLSSRKTLGRANSVNRVYCLGNRFWASRTPRFRYLLLVTFPNQRPSPYLVRVRCTRLHQIQATEKPPVRVPRLCQHAQCLPNLTSAAAMPSGAANRAYNHFVPFLCNGAHLVWWTPMSSPLSSSISNSVQKDSIRISRMPTPCLDDSLDLRYDAHTGREAEKET
jgi:hypothetical protein